MKHVWVVAAVAPLAFAASHAYAQKTVGGASSTPLSTSTYGDITINSAGSITIPSSAAPPTAVTLDSSNTVTNAGAITATGINNAIGIQANAGNTGEVIVTGSINLTETDTSKDANSDGVTDTENGVLGEYASGSGRYGILVTGTGTFTGITDSTNNSGDQTAVYMGGTVSVIGENSTGVAILTNVAGDVVIAGSVTVTGGNLGTTDTSYGVHTTGTITGNVKLTGTVTATGGNAVGVAIDNGATGAITVSDTITATGYRNTDPRTTYGLPTITIIENTPAEVQQGGSALWIGGTVGGGVDVTAAVAATTTVAAVTEGSVVSYGDAPALMIGNDTNTTTISPVSGDTHGIVIAGSVSSAGVYDNVNTTGMQIGSSSSISTLPVTVTGGISISGSLTATSYASPQTTVNPGNGSAVGLYIGSNANVPNIDVTGSVAASSLTNVTTANAPSVTAIQIAAGAGPTAITNNGAISAAITATDVIQNGVEVAQGGTAGTATAILDNGNSITSITNTNTISAGFSTANETDVVTGSSVAINVSNNTSGITVTQNPGTVTASDGTVTATSPAITGDILFGSGAANLILNTGTLTGDVFYGSNAGNTISIGDLANGTSATETGGVTVANGGSLAFNISDGELDITKTTGVITAPNFTVSAKGELVLTADPVANEYSEINASTGTLSVTKGAQIGLNLISALPSTATSTSPMQITAIVASPADAAQLTNFVLGSSSYLYHITLDTTSQPDALVFDASRSTAAQLGLNANQAAAYNAIYAAFTKDADVEADLLSKTTQTSFKKLYDQFLPDFAGGPFESLAIGQRAIVRTQEAEPLKLETDQTRGWVQEIGFLAHQGDADSAGYDAGGFGVAAGVEEAHGNGVVGVSGSFLSTEVADTGQSAYGHMAGSALEAGVYWRSNGTGVNANASLDGGYAWFGSQREILDTGPNPASVNNPDVPTTTATLQRVASAQWGGGIVSAQFGINAPIELGRFYLRPEASADYIALFEEGYTEKGGGSAFDLVVAPRTSQQASAQVDMVLGATFGDAIRYRPELMIGWRGVAYGGPGATTARFVSGDTNFTLNSNFQDRGGLLARLGLRAGGQFADFTADAGGEWHGNFDSYDARALARFLF